MKTAENVKLQNQSPPPSHNHCGPSIQQQDAGFSGYHFRAQSVSCQIKIWSSVLQATKADLLKGLTQTISIWGAHGKHNIQGVFPFLARRAESSSSLSCDDLAVSRLFCGHSTLRILKLNCKSSCFTHIKLLPVFLCCDTLISIYLLTAVGLSPGGSTHFHTNDTQNNRTTQITTNVEEYGPCPVLRVLPWH